jgi:hypothetical protein
MMNGPELHWTNDRWQQATIPRGHDNREAPIKTIRPGQYLTGFKALSEPLWGRTSIGRRVQSATRSERFVHFLHQDAETIDAEHG